MKSFLISLTLLLVCPGILWADITTGQVAWFRLLEGSGTFGFNDAGATELTLVNGVTWVAGPTSGKPAINFDGTNDYGWTNDGLVVRDTGTNNFTLSTWVKLDATGRNDLIVWKSSDGTDDISLYIDASNHLVIEAKLNSSTLGGITGSATFTTATWYHVAATKSTNTWTTYVNGVQDGTTTFAATLANHDQDEMWFGSNHSGLSPLSDFNLDGQMADIRIHSRGLSSSEVNEAMNYGRPRYRPGVGGIRRTAILSE